MINLSIQLWALGRIADAVAEIIGKLVNNPKFENEKLFHRLFFTLSNLWSDKLSFGS